jgi:hypothetical protein
MASEIFDAAAGFLVGAGEGAQVLRDASQPTESVAALEHCCAI